MEDIELRAFAIEGLAVETRDDGKRTLKGHAAVFNQLSEDLGGFREQVAPGAFAETLKTHDIRSLFNHDDNIVLGRNRAGTLRLAEDGAGLAIEVDLPDTQLVRDMVVSPIERGDVSQMSFRFRVMPNGQNWATDDEGRDIRTLTAVRLYEVSPVVFPAYPQTDVALREMRAWKDAAATNGRSAQPINLLKAKGRQALA